MAGIANTVAHEFEKVRANGVKDGEWASVLSPSVSSGAFDLTFQASPVAQRAMEMAKENYVVGRHGYMIKNMALGKRMAISFEDWEKLGAQLTNHGFVIEDYYTNHHLGVEKTLQSHMSEMPFQNLMVSQ